MSLHNLAGHLAAKGRNGDTMLVHMTPEEVGGLQALALSAYGKPLTVNPETGVVEASLLKRLLPTIAGALVGNLVPGAGDWASALVGGITAGATGGWKLKNIGAGMLGGYSGRQLGQRLANISTAPAPTAEVKTKPATEGTASAAAAAAAPPNTIAPGELGEIRDVAPVVAPKTPPEPVTPTFKNMGEGIRRLLTEEKLREQFMKDNLWPLAGAFGSYAMLPEVYGGPKQGKQRYWRQRFNPGTKVNPNWQRGQGEPYWLDRGWEEGEYVDDPDSFASGGSTHTEQPLKEGDVPVAVQGPAPTPAPAPTQRYYSEDYKSPYRDAIMSYIDEVNARRRPTTRPGAGTGAGGTTPGGTTPGGTTPGGTTPGGTTPIRDPGGTTRGDSTVADANEPMGGENTGYPVNVTGPGMPIMPTLPTAPVTPGYVGSSISNAFNAQLSPGIAGPSTSGGLYLPAGPNTSVYGGNGLMDLIGEAVGPGPQVPPEVWEAINYDPNATPPEEESSFLDTLKNAAGTLIDTANIPKFILGRLAGDTANNLLGGFAGNVVQGAINPVSLGNMQTWRNPATYNPAENRGIEFIKSVVAPGTQQTEEEMKKADKQMAKEEDEEKEGKDVSGREAGLTSSLYGSPYGIGVNTNKWASRTPQRPIVEAYSVASGGPIGGSYASGGVASLGGYSDGGRLLRGPGDGVSDDIPAGIYRNDGSRHEARLADGEFVFPARIVSEIGNGSTEAGARKLYAIMEKIQRDRSRTLKDVAKDTNAERHFASMMA